MQKNKYLPLVVMAGFIVSLAVVLPAFAQGMPGGFGGGFGGRSSGGMRGGMAPGVFGTVASVSGNTLTVAQRTRPNATTTPVTYTVDATNAKVMKNGTTSAISNIAVGDMVMVQGAVSGTNVTATVIRDGIVGMMGGRGMFASSTQGMSGNGMNAFGRRPTSTKPMSGTPPIQGDGEPVIAGSVASLNGSTLTVNNASNVTYTIDVSNATIVKGGASTTIASVVAGDNVIVQGAVNGTSVTASSVIDQGSGGQGAKKPASNPSAGLHLGVLGTIGNFFKHLFGF